MLETAQIQSQLRSDELAVYFDASAAIDLKRFSDFLLRANTVAKSKGFILGVSSVDPGSVKVVLRVLKKVKKAAWKEFEGSPIATTSSALSAVSIVATAIIASCSMIESGQVTPVAKATAKIVAEDEVTCVQVITRETRVTIMEGDRAARTEALSSSEELKFRRTSGQPALERTDFTKMKIEAASRDGIDGKVVDVNGSLHFRPKGYKFLVPISEDSPSLSQLEANKRYNVKGEIEMLDQFPDNIRIYAVYSAK